MAAVEGKVRERRPAGPAEKKAMQEERVVV